MSRTMMKGIRWWVLLLLYCLLCIRSVTAESSCPDSTTDSQQCQPNLTPLTTTTDTLNTNTQNVDVLHTDTLRQLIESVSQLTSSNEALMRKLTALENRFTQVEDVRTPSSSSSTSTTTTTGDDKYDPTKLRNNNPSLPPTTTTTTMTTDVSVLAELSESSTPPLVEGHQPVAPHETTPTTTTATTSAVSHDPISSTYIPIRVETDGFRMTPEERMKLHHRRTKKDLSSSDDAYDDSNASRRLLEWVQTAQTSDLAVGLSSSLDGHRGTYAVRNITAGETIISIPRGGLFDTSLAYGSVWTSARTHYKPHNELMWLAVYLLYDYVRPAGFRNGAPLDYGPESPFKPFYDILPVDFPTLPTLFDTRNEASDFHLWLGGSPTLNTIRMMIRDMTKEYEELSTILDEQGFNLFFTKSQWYWSRLIINTRAFSLDLPNQRHSEPGQPPSIRSSLIPLADMLNHASIKPSTTWGFDLEKDCFVMKVLKDLSKGDEITTTYGPRSNGHLFSQYGFVVDENPYNEAIVSLRVPTSTVDDDEDGFNLQAHKLRLLKLTHPGFWSETIDLNYEHTLEDTKHTSSPGSVYRCSFTSTIHPSYFTHCHSFGRLALATTNELLNIFMTDLPNSPKIDSTFGPISWANEIRMITYLRQSSEDQLQLYLKKVEEEIHFFKQHERSVSEGRCQPNSTNQQGCLTSNQRMMLIVRQGEKELLRMHVAIDIAVQAFVSNPPPDYESSHSWLENHWPSSVRTQVPYLYLQHILMPLYQRHMGWTQKQPTATTATTTNATPTTQTPTTNV